MVVVVGQGASTRSTPASSSGVAGGDLGARRQDLVEALDLREAEGCGQVVEAVVVAQPGA